MDLWNLRLDCKRTHDPNDIYIGMRFLYPGETHSKRDCNTFSSIIADKPDPASSSDNQNALDDIKEILTALVEDKDTDDSQSSSLLTKAGDIDNKLIEIRDSAPGYVKSVTDAIAALDPKGLAYVADKWVVPIATGAGGTLAFIVIHALWAELKNRKWGFQNKIRTPRWFRQLMNVYKKWQS